MSATARLLVFALLTLCLSDLFAAQMPADSTRRSARSVVMRRGEIVTLELRYRLDARTAQEGSIVELEVYHQVVVDGEVVVGARTAAEGVLVFVKKPGRLGSPGALVLRADNIMTTDGQRVPLRHLDRHLVKVSGKNAVLDIGTRIKAEIAYDVEINTAN